MSPSAALPTLAFSSLNLEYLEGFVTGPAAGFSTFIFKNVNFQPSLWKKLNDMTPQMLEHLNAHEKNQNILFLYLTDFKTTL